MGEKYYIRVGCMFLSYLTFESECVRNSFISGIKLEATNCGCDSFYESEANRIIDVLVCLGFGVETLSLERVE